MTHKERVAELSKRLREAGHLQDPHAQAIIQLVEANIEALKESLVEADGNDMLRKQGAIRHLQRMYRDLTVTPPNIAKSME